MSQLVKTKRQANFRDFKRFGAFKGLVGQKKNVVFNSFLFKLGFFWPMTKKPNLHTNSLNQQLLLGYARVTSVHFPLCQRMTLTTKIYCSPLYRVIQVLSPARARCNYETIDLTKNINNKICRELYALHFL
jgi:hypothetical protein